MASLPFFRTQAARLRALSEQCTALAPHRLRSLSERIDALVHSVIRRPAGIAVVQRLLREAVSVAGRVRDATVVELFVHSGQIGHAIRVLQAQISNIGLRLRLHLPSYTSALDARLSFLDSSAFRALLSTYCARPSVLLDVVSRLPIAELQVLHAALWLARNAALGPERVFAEKAGRAIELRLRAVRTPLVLPSPSSTPASSTYLASGAHARSPPVIPLALPAYPSTSPALRASAPATQPLPSLPLSFSPRSMRFEAQRISFSSPGPEGDPMLFPAAPLGAGESFGTPLSLERERTASGLCSASASHRAQATTITYRCPASGAEYTWQPFPPSSWAWPSPSTVPECRDWNSATIRAGSTVLLIGTFSSLDAVLALGVLEGVVPPIASGAGLHTLSRERMKMGTKLRVLRIFSVRGQQTWLAALPLEESRNERPALVPLSCVLDQHSGNPPASLPRHFIAPLHGSARFFAAVYVFLDDAGQRRAASVRGIVHARALSYFEDGPASHAQRRWFHIPYSRMLSLHYPAPGVDRGLSGREVRLCIRENAQERELSVRFASVEEAQAWERDVKWMHARWLAAVRLKEAEQS